MPENRSNAIKPHIALIALAAWLPGTLQAAGKVAALKDTVIAKFSDEDQRLMMARIDTALKAATDGEPLDWKNERTGASGTVTPLNRLTWDGLDCRRLKVVNRYRTMSGEGVYRFCEKPKGQWKLVGPDGSGG
jgi:surface antigen